MPYVSIWNIIYEKKNSYLIKCRTWCITKRSMTFRLRLHIYADLVIIMGFKLHTIAYTCLCSIFKAALINIFVLTIDQMTLCNVKGVPGSDEPTENYHPTLQFPSALRSILASFSSLFWFSGPQLCYSGSLSPLSSILFPVAAGVLFSKGALILYATCPARDSRQAKLVTSW